MGCTSFLVTAEPVTLMIASDKSKTHIPRLTQAVPWLVLAALITFTYAWLVEVPYAGFTFTRDIVLNNYFPSETEYSLQSGDQLLKVGELDWQRFQDDIGLVPFDGVKPGDSVPIIVQRDGQIFQIDWVYPGFTQTEFIERLGSQWAMAYIFWVVGTATFLLVRPKNALWQLLVTFNYLTALWLAIGSGVSRSHVWGSAIIVRCVIWLSVFVYLHLHWTFPKPLKRLPHLVWWISYGTAGLFVLMQIFQLLPQSAYYFGFLLAIAGSLLLLVLHYLLQKEYRKSVRFVFLAAGFALFPSVFLGVILSSGTFNPLTLVGTSLLTLPILPFAYFYAIYRRQFGGLELRANRLISTYLFLVTLFFVFLILIPLTGIDPDAPGQPVLIALGAAFLATILTLVAYNPFRRFIEYHVLGMPLPPTHLLQAYTDRITTALETERVVELLRDEILPSLLVRQSALLGFDPNHRPTVIYAQGVTEEQVPTSEALASLMSQALQYRLPLSNEEVPLDWVRLVVPLEFGESPIGVWLLGRRDPDDYYAQSEIGVLASLANATAIALTNVSQAENLRALYQADISRYEAERETLARNLHDEVLNQLGSLYLGLEGLSLPPSFHESHQQLSDDLRKLVYGLRPPLLNYGLTTALEGLIDDLNERRSRQTELLNDLPSSSARFEPDVELHIFRIVQQACENALRHADAQTIHLHGHVAPDHIDLTVEDDGIGFSLAQPPDLASLLAQGHFGIASIFERAALIHARLQIESHPGGGTRLHVHWRSPADDPSARHT